MFALFFSFGILLATSNLTAPASWTGTATNYVDGIGAVLGTNIVTRFQLVNIFCGEMP